MAEVKAVHSTDTLVVGAVGLIVGLFFGMMMSTNSQMGQGAFTRSTTTFSDSGTTTGGMQFLSLEGDINAAGGLESWCGENGGTYYAVTDVGPNCHFRLPGDGYINVYKGHDGQYRGHITP